VPCVQCAEDGRVRDDASDTQDRDAREPQEHDPAEQSANPRRALGWAQLVIALAIVWAGYLLSRG